MKVIIQTVCCKYKNVLHPSRNTEVSILLFLWRLYSFIDTIAEATTGNRMRERGEVTHSKGPQTGTRIQGSLQRGQSLSALPTGLNGAPGINTLILFNTTCLK